MKKFVSLCILSASLLPVAAFAGGHSEAEGHAENYVGLSVTKLTSGPSSTGAAVIVGHNYNEHFAAEVTYEDSGLISSAPERTTAFSVAAVGKVPFNEDFEGYGRLGYASASTKDALGASATHGDITYGFGVEYRVNAKYSVGLGWDRLRVGDNNVILRANEDSYALSVFRHF